MLVLMLVCCTLDGVMIETDAQVWSLQSFYTLYAVAMIVRDSRLAKQIAIEGYEYTYAMSQMNNINQTGILMVMCTCLGCAL